ncbi:MAG: hypothetical protein ABJH04_06975 [Cyclobacteriaceae bacterium]
MIRTQLKRIVYGLCLTVLLLPFHASAQVKQDTLKVLFVGNSYTYFWNLPQLVSAMAESQGIIIQTRQSTEGGTSLEQHWKGEKNIKSKELIKNGNWDVVVLQNLSTSTINSPESFSEFGKNFISLVKDKKAKPLLYMTWAREHNPLMQQQITDGYEQLGKETQTQVIPVGEIWMKALDLRPDLKLYFADGSHPSPLGTYLTALAFFKQLTGKPTAKIPNRIISTDKDGEKLYLTIQTQEDADFLQQLVDEFTFDI